MRRALVVVDPTDSSRDLLREAGELAAGVGANLIVLSLLTEEAYERDREMLDTIAREERTDYPDESIADYADRAAAGLADDVLAGIDVEYDPRGVVLDGDDRGATVVRVAEEAGCDHVFLVGKRRSPTGKAVFGDTAQSVILNFGGRTTVAMADE
ncbi:universal stress protein [Halomarina oriensis]|uniref:Universal stress protein n=1 Tax=Halomarina oriensis TaxID=671145 RepID=A0A6B0GIY5_9EURY|nr:universal stress protein [Halomarina oriensis]MWG33817.1 universal stress protein [Halomarina oriensis]